MESDLYLSTDDASSHDVTLTDGIIFICNKDFIDSIPYPS